MYYNLLTRKQDPAYSRLKGLTRLLLNFIDIKCIYFSPHIGKPVNRGIVTVIITEDSPHYWDDINEYLWKVVQAFQEFSLRIYNEEWLQEEIDEGCLFFILHRHKETLIYKLSGSTLPEHDTINCKQVVKKARKRLKQYTNENQIIRRDLKYHLRSENYTFALYTLHQQLRNLYIYTSWLLTGEWHVLQSLREQSEHLSRYTYLPQMLFNTDNKDDDKILELLDKSCDIIQGRTKDGNPAGKEIVNAASEKLELAVKEVQNLLTECISKTKGILK